MITQQRVICILTVTVVCQSNWLVRYVCPRGQGDSFKNGTENGTKRTQSNAEHHIPGMYVQSGNDWGGLRPRQGPGG